MDSRMLAGGTVTEWHAGQHVEAGWGILANRKNSQGSGGKSAREQFPGLPCTLLGQGRL